MKKFFLNLILITALLFISQDCKCAYNMSVPAEGDSIADNELQSDVMKKLYKSFSLKNPSCLDFSIKDTVLLHEPYDVKKKNGKYIEGYWEELWTINICGKNKQVPVTFYIKKGKTLFKINEYFLTE